MSASKSKSLSFTIGVLWFVAAVYTAGVLYLIFNTQVANCAGNGTISLWPDFLAAIRCLEPNQLGDALAGLFAPLAFLGLVIGIVYQRRDLAIQREDMELTRDEMKASTTALKAQAEEAQRTAEFMRVQTLALENERRHAELEGARYSFVTWLQTHMEHRELAGWTSSMIQSMPHGRFFEHLYQTVAVSNRMLVAPNTWNKAKIHEIADELDRLAELAAKIEDQRTLVFDSYRFSKLAHLVRVAGDKLSR